MVASEVGGIQRLRSLLAGAVRRLGLLERGQLTCCGVTLAQCHALQEVELDAGLSVGELAARLGVDASTASRMVDGLVERGWVARHPVPGNRRAVTLTLTVPGASTVASVHAQADAWAARVWSAIPEAERAAVLPALETLVGALERCCSAPGTREVGERGA